MTRFALVLPLISAVAVAQSFCDDTLSQWTSQMVNSTQAGFTTSHPQFGHVAPPSLQFTHNVQGAIYLVHLPPNPSGTFSLPNCPDTVPVQLEAWVRVASGAGFGGAVGFQWAALQNGTTYLSSGSGTSGFFPVRDDDTWHHLTDSLPLSRFFSFSVPGNPSFAAGPIQFGIMSANSCFCGFFQQATGWIDEFCVRVDLAPSVTPGGPGCTGSLGVPTLASGPGQLGQPLNVTIGNLPLAAAVLIVGFSDTTSTVGPLPFDMTNVGAPGCLLRVSLDLQYFLLGTGTSATFTGLVPDFLSLLCVHVYLQGASFDPPANPLGIVMSNSVDVLIGN